MFKATIDSVLGDISKKIGQLRDLAEVHAAKAEFHQQEALTHNELNRLQSQLRERATRVAEKFEELLK